jgi:hypothetical protein
VLVATSGVAASDIDSTARSFVRVINRYASNTTVYAYYLTGPDDLPGQMMIEEKGLGASAFTLQTNNSTLSTMFFPAPPVSTATTEQCTSSNDVATNRVYYSKYGELEHVPLLNYVNVGPANKEILRIITLRDSAIVIKKEGVYRLTGETPQSFTVVPVDLTVFCKAADSVVALANQVLMLSNQGVVLISEGGVQVISREIEPNIIPILANTSLASYTSAVGYESERSYFLSTIESAAGTVQNITYVYNIFTRTWVRHTYAFKSAVVEPSSDKLHFVKPTDTKVYQERKAFDETDYADPEYSITITSINGTEVEFTLSSAAPGVGWSILQGTTTIPIDSVETISGGYRAVLNGSPPSSWATGSASIFPPVSMNLEFHSWTGQAGPETLKQVRLVGIFTDDIPGNNSVQSLIVSFSTNFDPETESVELVQPGEGWGGAWGSTPWGGTGDSFGYPTYVPRNKQYCGRLRLGVRHLFAREHLVITGLGFVYEATSDRIGR